MLGLIKTDFTAMLVDLCEANMLTAMLMFTMFTIYFTVLTYACFDQTQSTMNTDCH